jgi:hypothetical protein
LLVACAATPEATGTAPPTGSATVATPGAGTADANPTAAPETPAPDDSGLFSPGPLETPDPNGGSELPEPTLTDPGLIGQALYDPSTASQGTVSLIDQMGVEVRSFDGAVVRPGVDRGAGHLWLPEAAVSGLVEMTVDDLAEAGDTGGPISIADLYEGLKSSLPSDFTVDQFAAAYDEAYRKEPGSLAAGVMLGQPITSETRLLRVQMWLLLIDGFVRSDQAGSMRTAALGARAGTANPHPVRSLLSAGNTLGAGALYQPPAASPIAGMSDQDWLSLLATLPTLAYWIPFEIQRPASMHEGHGGLGPRRDWTARYRRPGDVVTRTGTVLLRGDSPGSGLEMAWGSEDLSVLYDHGQLSDVTGRAVLTDGSGAIKISYQTQKEKANGRGLSISEPASLYAYVDQLQLVIWAYQLPPEVIEALGCHCLIRGTRRALNSSFTIGWHSEDVLQISIENYYRYTIEIATFPRLLELHRDGIDRITGILARTADDEYRGRLDAISQGHATGSAFLGLAGIGTCGANDHEIGVQSLYVIADEVGTNDLVLRLYPATAPDGDFTLCQPVITNSWGDYLPLNDTRWSTPTQGYEIEIPQDFGTISYVDQTAIVPSLKVCSAFYVSVTRPDPSLEPALSPTPVPTPPPGPRLCQGPDPSP